MCIRDSLHAVALFRYTDRPVPHCVGEDMVKLMRQDPAQGTTVFLFPVPHPERQQSGLYKLPYQVAIDVRERQNLPVADVRPTQCSFKFAVRHQARRVASSLKRHHRQFRGNFVSLGLVQIAPLETKSDRRHDRLHFILECLQHARRRCLLKLCVQCDGGKHGPPRFAPAGKNARQEAKQSQLQCKDLAKLLQTPVRCRSVTSSGCSFTSLFAVWHAKQTGNAAASVPTNLSAGIWFHSTLTRSATSRAGRLPVQSISPIACPHAAQALSRYHLAMTLRTRQSAPDSRTSLRHSCPHPAFSGQREHSLSRNSGALPNTVAAACAASTTTPAGRLVSGHVITRWPRYFNQVLPSHTAAPARRTAATAKTDISIRNSEIILANQPPLSMVYQDLAISL